MSTDLRSTISEYTVYGRRVEAMLNSAVRLNDSIDELLQFAGTARKSVHEDTNTQGYEGFEHFMAPCIIVEWRLRDDSYGVPVYLEVRLTTSFDDENQETLVIAHQSESSQALTFSVAIELCPDFEGAVSIESVVSTALARVEEYRDKYSAKTQ